MNKRMVWSGLGVGAVALALMLASMTGPVSNTRADGGKDRPSGSREFGGRPAIVPAAGVAVEEGPRAAGEPAPPSGAPAPSFPVPPAGARADFPPPPGGGEAGAGMVSVHEVIQLKHLKRRIGGENIKRLIDALGD